MKLILSVIFIFLTAISFSQVKLDVSSEEYSNLKMNGNLAGFEIISSTRAGELARETVVKPTPSKKTSSVCDCWNAPDATYTLAMTPNDDGSTSLISLPFDFCLYGQVFNNCYINNNGNISFGSPYATFSADAFPSSNFVMVAPFWGDVDTRGAGEVWYKLTDTALIVNWVAVGYYNQEVDKLNSFQVTITNGQDPVVPDGNNVAFCYQDMQWTTGAASSGIDGFGGTPATVGANLGNGINFVQLGRFDQPGAAFDGPFGNPDGIDWLDNKYFILNTCVDGNNIAPFTSSSGVCDTLEVCQGGATTISFLGPEEDQTISIDYTTEAPDDITVSSTGDLGSTEVVIGVTESIAAGTYQVSITATDNGTPALSTNVIYFVNVVEDNSPPIVINGPAGLCQGESGTLSVDNVYDSYNWNTGSQTNSTSIDGPGTYSLTAMSSICLKFSEITVDGFPNPEPTIDGELLICANATTTLSTAETYSSYSWTGGGTEQSTEVGQGSFTVTVENEFGCTGSTTVDVGTLPVPELPQDQDVCGFEFEVSGIDPNFNGQWEQNFTEGHNADFSEVLQINTSIVVNDIGTYDFTFTDDCGISDQMTLNFIPLPDFTFQGQTFCEGDDVVVAPEGGYLNEFTWSWESGSNDWFENFDVSGYYTFTASNSCGSASDSAEFVAISCEINIPNVFTPNGDDKNIAFVIDGLGHFPGSQLTVYNRWGSVVYEAPSYNNSWDAEGVGQGTYYYVLNLRLPGGTIKEHSGTITVLRN